MNSFLQKFPMNVSRKFAPKKKYIYLPFEKVLHCSYINRQIQVKIATLCVNINLLKT